MEKDPAPRRKLWELIREQRFAMLATHHEGDALRSRPMTTVERAADAAPEDDTLWFFAPRTSEVAQDIRRRAQVCLSYGDSVARFVSVAGRAAVVEDPARKQALWNPMVEAWFPQGPTSPEVVLLAVSPEHAEYWDANSNRLVQLFTVAQALASGVPPRAMSEHREVDLADRLRQ